MAKYNNICLKIMTLNIAEYFIGLKIYKNKYNIKIKLQDYKILESKIIRFNIKFKMKTIRKNFICKTNCLVKYNNIYCKQLKYKNLQYCKLSKLKSIRISKKF